MLEMGNLGTRDGRVTNTLIAKREWYKKTQGGYGLGE